MDEYYVGLDGDSIGRVIESLLIMNKPDEVIQFSQKIVMALENIKEQVEGRKGKVLFCSGDSILFQGKFDLPFCKKILVEFHRDTGKTASIGLGKTTAQTYLGLKLAKSKGGNRAEVYKL